MLNQIRRLKVAAIKIMKYRTEKRKMLAGFHWLIAVLHEFRVFADIRITAII